MVKVKVSSGIDAAFGAVLCAILSSGPLFAVTHAFGVWGSMFTAHNMKNDERAHAGASEDTNTDATHAGANEDANEDANADANSNSNADVNANENSDANGNVPGVGADQGVNENE